MVWPTLVVDLSSVAVRTPVLPVAVSFWSSAVTAIADEPELGRS